MPAYKKTGTITWTSDLAYAVGLITTDGNLSKDGRHLDFTSNDIDQIETFKKILGLKNTVSKKKSGFTGKFSSLHIQFGNVILYKWLCEIGLMPNKSKIVAKLKVPDEYFFDFLRGHLDGDGCIKKYFDPVYPKSLRLYISFMSASLPHLLWIQDTVNKLINIKGFIAQVQRAHTLNYSKQSSLKLLPYIYPNPKVPYLKRKFIKVQEFINF